MLVFENFKSLKTDMEENRWVIEAFSFNYKNRDYIVLAKLFLKHEKKPQYALLKTQFIKANNANESLTLPVNSNGFITNKIKSFREFFNINYSNNMGDILQQFNLHFSRFIPTHVNPNKSKKLEQSMVASLSKSDSENPNKVYCYAVTRKGNRTDFNDNKTKLLRPDLYLKFKTDSTISFCYKSDKAEEKSDEDILRNFAKRIKKESI